MKKPAVFAAWLDLLMGTSIMAGALLLFLTAAVPAGAANLIVNGDFSSGNTDFTTQYVYYYTHLAYCTPDMGEGCYAVVTDPHLVHSGFSSFGDHTSGSGNMLVANGAPAADYVWQQSVAVAADTNYLFTTWATSLASIDPAPANLLIEVDLTADCTTAADFKSVGSVNATGYANDWVENRTSLLTGSSTQICIRIVNNNTASNGNDFALDDISLDIDLTAPTTAADTASTKENVPVNIDVLNNDTAGTDGINASSVDLDPTITGIQTTKTVAGGTFSVSSGVVTFTPDSNFVGTSSVTYQVSSNGGTPSNVSDITVTVIPMNVPPTLSATADNPTYTEGGAAATLFSGASVSTVESGQTITNLTLTVSNVTDGAAEILNIGGTDMALTNGNAATTATDGMSASVGVTGSAATVTLHKTAGISSAAAQTLVDGITYRDNTQNPTAGSRVATLTSITDSGGTANGGQDTTSLSIASTVSVVPVDNPPVVTTSAGTTAFTEAGGAVAIDGGLTVTDVDSSALASGTVSISGNFHAGEDLLAFTNTNSFTYGNITASYDGGTGVLTLTSSGATATVAQWQAALRSVTYNNSSSNPNTALRTVSFAADDGSLTSSAATKAISVTAVNNAPVVTVPGAQNVTTNQPVTVSGVSVSDVDAGSKIISVTLSDLHGNLSVTAVGSALITGEGTGNVTVSGSLADVNATLVSLSYVTTLSITGSDTITVNANDGGNTGTGGPLSDSKTITVNVTANDVPVFSAPASESYNDTSAHAISGVSFSDTYGGTAYTANLSDLHGNLSVTAVGSALITGEGTGNVTVSGSLADVNATLASLSYATTLSGVGSDTITISVNDGGTTLIGGAQTGSKTMGITITAHVVIAAATGNGDITLDTTSPGCSFTSYGSKTEAQVADDPWYDYPYGLVEFTLNCASADVKITFPGDISGDPYRKYGPTTPGDVATTKWYTFRNALVSGKTATLHLVDGQLGDDSGVDGIIVDAGGPAASTGNASVAVPAVTGWGDILFMLLAGIFSVFGIRSGKRT